MSESPIIEIQNLRKTYRVGKVDVHALRGVDLSVARGEFVSIVGPSGSGKSTLFHIIGGLTPATSGVVKVGDTDLSKMSDPERTQMRKTVVGFVFQKYNLLPTLTAADNIAIARDIAGQDPKPKADFEKVLELLGIADRLRHKPFELSGGEQQRVAIARAVANAPRALLADEPTGNLDPHTADHVFSALMQLVKATRVAMLIATHNMDLAARMDRRVSLVDGQVVEMA